MVCTANFERGQALQKPGAASPTATRLAEDPMQLHNMKHDLQAAAQIVHRALHIVGIPGYKNDSLFSLGRRYRDVLPPS